MFHRNIHPAPRNVNGKSSTRSRTGVFGDHLTRDIMPEAPVSIPLSAESKASRLGA